MSSIPARPEPAWLLQAWMLLFFVAASFSAGFIGANATAGSINGWYRTLEKPDWNPPDWIFGPAWTTLYLLMGIAAWLVWRESGWIRGGVSLSWFAFQLVLNSFWSLLFFGLQKPGWAFMEILALLAAIAITTRSFRRHSSLAMGLMVPYLAWTTFATALNFSIWILNR